MLKIISKFGKQKRDQTLKWFLIFLYLISYFSWQALIVLPGSWPEAVKQSTYSGQPISNDDLYAVFYPDIFRCNLIHHFKAHYEKLSFIKTHLYNFLQLWISKILNSSLTLNQIFTIRKHFYRFNNFKSGTKDLKDLHSNNRNENIDGSGCYRKRSLVYSGWNKQFSLIKQYK